MKPYPKSYLKNSGGHIGRCFIFIQQERINDAIKLNNHWNKAKSYIERKYFQPSIKSDKELVVLYNARYRTNVKMTDIEKLMLLV